MATDFEREDFEENEIVIVADLFGERRHYWIKSIGSQIETNNGWLWDLDGQLLKAGGLTFDPPLPWPRLVPDPGSTVYQARVRRRRRAELKRRRLLPTSAPG